MCNINSTGLWLPACGEGLITVPAFQLLAKYSYPGEGKGVATWFDRSKYWVTLVEVRLGYEI
jgi:hypothetical protein